MAMFGKVLRAGKEFFATDTFHVKNPSVWHAKFYLYWLKHGGQNKANYKENWCHYWRVVLLYTPRKWIFAEEVLWKFVPHWVIALSFLIFFLNVLVFSRSIPSATIDTVGLLFIWSAMAFALHVGERSIKWTGSRLEQRGYNVDAWGNRLGTVVGIFFLLMLLGLAGFAAFQWPIRFALGVGALFGLIAVLALGYTAVVRVQDWRYERRFHRDSTRRNVVLDNIVGTIRFFAQFVIKPKRKVCPYVEFDFDPRAHLKI